MRMCLEVQRFGLAPFQWGARRHCGVKTLDKPAWLLIVWNLFYKNLLNWNPFRPSEPEPEDHGMGMLSPQDGNADSKLGGVLLRSSRGQKWFPNFRHWPHFHKTFTPTMDCNSRELTSGEVRCAPPRSQIGSNWCSSSSSCQFHYGGCAKTSPKTFSGQMLSQI